MYESEDDEGEDLSLGMGDDGDEGGRPPGGEAPAEATTEKKEESWSTVNTLYLNICTHDY